VIFLFHGLEDRGSVCGHFKSLGNVQLGGLHVGFHLLAVDLWFIAQEDGHVDVGWGTCFGIVQQGDDGYQDRLDPLGRRPALGGEFAGHFIVAGGVEDGNAQFAVGIDIRMVERLQELELCA
jgi:hypothetical protein